jgi:hypothetical protein
VQQLAAIASARMVNLMDRNITIVEARSRNVRQHSSPFSNFIARQTPVHTRNCPSLIQRVLDISMAPTGSACAECVRGALLIEQRGADGPRPFVKH